MRILDNYIARHVIASSATVLLVLLAIFTFFMLIDELEQVGRGSYAVPQVLFYTALRIPGLVYELFPMAALIGSLLGLGTMMRNGEITVIRAAGVSKLRVVKGVMKAGLVLVITAMLIGEFLAPAAATYAREYRSMAINNRITMKTQNGFWARDGDSYINIREILPGDQLREIFIYEFDADNRLRTSTFAESARFHEDRWILENISQTLVGDEDLQQRHTEVAAWDSLLRPDLISVVAIQPDSLAIWTLVKFIGFLQTNGQDSARYEHALWIKIVYPLATGVMVFLAIPMVMRANRSTPVGQRIIIGGLIGLGFHLLNQAAGHLGIVFDIPPFVSAAGPAIAMFAVGSLLVFLTD
ncbi:MAG: LPS export ABC transporter permease LptG [Gammaproteobacteria bacterium]